jgi:uncharacterized protein (DUF3820 family)
MNAEVVPFGKYKGQPVAALAADEDYCEWLTAQPWFKQKYGNVYNILIQGGAEPQDSPEHNEMQARFLDEDWCRRLGAVLWPRTGLSDVSVYGLSFEVAGWDVAFELSIAVMARLDGRELGLCAESGCARVELKPDLGDDYPAVLRQVQAYKPPPGHFSHRCVVARRHQFEHVTWDQVRRIFAASHIALIAESQIESAVPMPWVEDVQ